MSTDWKDVWLHKGRESTTNLKQLNGYESTEIDSKYVVESIKLSLDIHDDTTSVLEVGCGAGQLAVHFNQEYHGIDFSETLIEKFKDIVGGNAQVANADNIPFDDKSVDCVFAFSVFHYFPDREYVNRVISEMTRVAKRGVFIGDLPLTSHDSNHQLFTKDDFIGWSISDGYYTINRFNAYKTII
jgi:ubiquinone/menaquinone biosynthesis C-methylase UbiE